MTEAKTVFEYALKNNCSVVKAIKKAQEDKKIREFLSTQGHRSNFQRTMYRTELQRIVFERERQVPRYEFLKREDGPKTLKTAEKMVIEYEKSNFEGRIMSIEVKKAYEILSKIK